MGEQTSDGQQTSAEQVPIAQAKLAGKDALKARRTGQTCITLFVVFLLALFAFGKKPLTGVGSEDGARVDFNVLSCLGVAGGVFAIIFMAVYFKRVFRLSLLRKALGLVAAVGLIAHTAIALLAPLAGDATCPPPGVPAGYAVLARSGAEKWVVDGKTYTIESTYYLDLPEGLQYTISHPHRPDRPYAEMDDEAALVIAFPLMKHAYAKGLYRRAIITKVGRGVLTPSRIGVALFEVRGERARGYRVALSFEGIRARLRRSAPATSTSQVSTRTRPRATDRPE